MKTLRHLPVLIMTLCFVALFSCSKEEYFKSESGIKKQLQGSWSLIPIPRTNPDQNWAFNNSAKMTRSENGLDYTGDFNVHTTISKAEIKIENLLVVSGQFDYNGTWQIVQLDDDFLIIANDRDGTSGIKQLEFTKKK
ncbi:MAG: hypothetical protein IPI10_09565 [Bacteroidetes bacterium]|nr:hypothetical protein [Bacteroidota bacterium]MBK7571849.1 hypothetical protein [Bacteroidota bacterium]MBK8587403.1 hypothetical protein [Bacteroidota bacterium]MBP9791154.1 hypothetical protein [Bacteroidia bacterium]